MRQWPGWGKAALTVLLIVIVVGAVLSQRPVADAQGGGSISYGSKVLGRISADLPEVMYSFNGTAGDLIQVRVKNWVGTLDPQVTLLAPDGQNAGSSTRSPFAVESQDATLALFLPQTGVYMLLVSAESGTNGQFLLTLQGRGMVVATPLVYGQGLDVVVPLNPQPQYFVFETEDCPTVFTVANLSEGQPFTFPFMIKVRNAQGNLIALLYGGDAVEDRLVLPARSGRYEVEVLSEDPRQQGMIHLLVSCADQAPGCIGGGMSGAADATGLAAECPSCFSEDFGGEECAEFEVTATHEGDSTFSFTWPAVEGADWYIFQIIDAWGIMLADSPILLEGETSHLYAIQPADFDRGPFTAIVRAGSGTEVGELICVDEIQFSFEGPVPECVMAVRVDIVPGEERRAVASWSAAPGAAAYTLHIYAYGDDGGLIGIRVFTVPGDHTTYHLEGVFPADYTRFQVNVRAYSEATGGGAFGDMPQGFLCGGSADVEFGPTGPVHWGPAA
ncbi:MAG: hypothetical protein AB1435_16600 [Chloroflexota bacterium]|jgi:hypothetical protein